MKERFDASSQKKMFTVSEIEEARKIISDDLVKDELWKYFAKRTATERKKVLNLQLEINVNFKKYLKLTIEEVFAIAMYFVKKKNHNYFSTVEQIKVKKEREVKRKNKKRRANQKTVCAKYMPELHQLKLGGMSTKDAIEVLYRQHRSDFWGQKPTAQMMNRYYANWRKEKNIAIAQEPPAVPVPAVEPSTINIFKKIAERAELSSTTLLGTGNDCSADI